MNNYDKLYDFTRKQAGVLLEKVERLNKGFQDFYADVEPKRYIKDFSSYMRNNAEIDILDYDDETFGLKKHTVILNSKYSKKTGENKDIILKEKGNIKLSIKPNGKVQIRKDIWTLDEIKQSKKKVIDTFRTELTELDLTDNIKISYINDYRFYGNYEINNLEYPIKPIKNIHETKANPVITNINDEELKKYLERYIDMIRIDADRLKHHSEKELVKRK